MPTLHQLYLGKQQRLRKKTTTTTPSLQRCPQKKGVVRIVVILDPKKPNSAKRHIAKVKLSNKKKIRAGIPGEHRNKDRSLKQFSKVLIRGGRSRDIIGVRYKVIPGRFDAKIPQNRWKSRSKYGIRKPILTAAERLEIASWKISL